MAVVILTTLSHFSDEETKTYNWASESQKSRLKEKNEIKFSCLNPATEDPKMLVSYSHGGLSPSPLLLEKEKKPPPPIDLSSLWCDLMWNKLCGMEMQWPHTSTSRYLQIRIFRLGGKVMILKPKIIEHLNVIWPTSYKLICIYILFFCYSLHKIKRKFLMCINWEKEVHSKVEKKSKL